MAKTESNFTDSFQSFLSDFHETIAEYPNPEKVKGKLTEIKEKASLDSQLTFHQKEAIRGRCDNFMNGHYGDQRMKQDNRSEYQKKLN